MSEDDLSLPDLGNDAATAPADPGVPMDTAGDPPSSDRGRSPHRGRSRAGLRCPGQYLRGVLGKAHVDVNSLLRLTSGSVLELDRKVGEAIDIYVNSRLVARGEVVVVDDRLGVTMTEIIKDGDTG
jgi:flagellar motor switch protein FliN/FliY